MCVDIVTHNTNISFIYIYSDAEEEENQPQLQPSSGSPHRLGDGLPGTPAALCIHQVRPTDSPLRLAAADSSSQHVVVVTDVSDL